MFEFYLVDWRKYINIPWFQKEMRNVKAPFLLEKSYFNVRAVSL